MSTKNGRKLSLDIAKQLNARIIRTIESHNTPSIILICERGTESLFVKYEVGGIDNSVRKEILWYSKIGNRLDYVPKYLGKIENGDYSALVLEFVENAATIDNLVVQESETDLIDQSISKSISHLETLFEENPPKKVNLKQANELYVEKFSKRFKLAQEYEYLKALFKNDEIVINGKEHPNLIFYVERISRDRTLLEKLTPCELGVIHGDLHCGNILVRKGGDVFFVDPNGNLSMPIEYDYGKILHSIHGCYGQIMRDKYILEERDKNEFNFSVEYPVIYQTVYRRFRDKLSYDLLVKSLYSEAMHFATMLPHHAISSKETKALFLTSLITFRKLFKILGLN